MVVLVLVEDRLRSCWIAQSIIGRIEGLVSKPGSAMLDLNMGFEMKATKRWKLGLWCFGRLSDLGDEQQLVNTEGGCNGG